MKTRIISILILVIVFTSMVTACISKNNYLIEVLKLSPQNTIIVVNFNLELMESDPDLVEMYDFVRFQQGEILTDIVGSDIEVQAYSVVQSPEWDIIWFIRCNYNLSDVHNTLKEWGFVSSEYEGTEIWNEDIVAVTVLDKMIIVGHVDFVKATIRVSKNIEASLYDYEDIKSVSNKLPRGIRNEVYYGAACAGIGNPLCGGISMRNLIRDDDIVDIKCWYKYESESDAQIALAVPETLIPSYFNATNVEYQLKGVFAEITAFGDIPTE